MKSDFKIKLIEKYEEFSFTENLSDKTRLKADIESMLNAENELDSNSYHIWGLIDFESDNWKENLEISKSNFRKAIELDKDNFLAQLYLAHCYHDLNKLELALENYLKVDNVKLKEFQTWRHVKLIEQIGYCYYKLGNQKKGVEHFEKVLEFYKNLPEESDRARPSELLECLPNEHRIVKEIKLIEDYLE